MLLVKTHIAPSPIHGIGLFASERIPKDTTIWRYTEGLDLSIGTDAFENLTPRMREFVLHHAYVSIRTGQYVLHADNARFINHSTDANVQSVRSNNFAEDIDVAVRDIAEGEELTEDYMTFDGDFERKIKPQKAHAGSLDQAA